MTTIAYKDGVMAGDGRVTSGSTIVASRLRKVFKLRDGRIVGCCGNVDDLQSFVAAMRKATVLEPELPLLGVDALIVDPVGRVSFFEKGGWLTLKGRSFALGSGSDFALGAMDAGSTAPEAVRIAAGRDCQTGGRIITIKLER